MTYAVLQLQGGFSRHNIWHLLVHMPLCANAVDEQQLFSHEHSCQNSTTLAHYNISTCDDGCHALKPQLEFLRPPPVAFYRSCKLLMSYTCILQQSHPVSPYHLICLSSHRICFAQMTLGSSLRHANWLKIDSRRRGYGQDIGLSHPPLTCISNQVFTRSNVRVLWY